MQATPHAQKEVRLLLVTAVRPKQAGNQSLARTLRHLVSEGYSVDVLALGYRKKDIDADIWTEHGINLRPEQITVPFQQFLRTLYGTASNLVRHIILPAETQMCSYPEVSERVELSNNKVGQWTVLLPINLIFLIRAVYLGLRRYHELRHSYDIIWGYELSGAVAGKAVAAIADLSFVTSYQGTILEAAREARSSDVQVVIRYPFDTIGTWVKSDLVVMTDDGTGGAKSLEWLGHKEVDVLCLPNGVDSVDFRKEVPRFTDAPAVGAADSGCERSDAGQIVCLMAVRLERWKRVDRGVKLLKALRESGEMRFTLRIAGDGSERRCLEELAGDLGLTEEVTFLGWKEYSAVVEEFGRADMLWSFQDYSNLNNSVQDALAWGLPVVTLDDGSLHGFLRRCSYSREEIELVRIAREQFLVDGVVKLRGWSREDVGGMPVGKVWTWDQRMSAVASRIRRLR